MPISSDSLPTHWFRGEAKRLGPHTFTDGERVVTHLPSPRKHRQALHFYREIVPRLWALGARTPELIEVEGAYLLRTWHPGEADPSPAAHQAAGRWLRALHSLDGVPHDPMSLVEAMGKRVAALVPQLPAPWKAPLLGLDLSALAGLQRVWCHRDLHPRNWLWDGARLVVFDFEHAAPDLGALDWVRVPDQAALLEGYGGIESKDERALFIAELVNAAGTLAWGLRHQDAHWVFTGQQRLRALIPIG